MKVFKITSGGTLYRILDGAGVKVMGFVKRK